MALRIGARSLWGGLAARASIFVSIWIVGLGVGGLLGEVDWSLVRDRPWIAAPVLFPFGGPGFGWGFSLAAIAAVLAGYLASMVESLGDYAATCAAAGAPLEVGHMNRGIAAEGFGSALAACFGGLPCTSYTQNVGIIAATGVASRAVVRVAGVILLLYGLSPKFGGLLVALPRPVLGGVFLIVCGMIAVSGIDLLRRAAPTAENRTLAGLTLVTALGVPLAAESGLGEAWLEGLPGLPRLVVTNPVVLAVILAVGLHLLFGPGRDEAEGE